MLHSMGDEFSRLQAGVELLSVEAEPLFVKNIDPRPSVSTVLAVTCQYAAGQ